MIEALTPLKKKKNAQRPGNDLMVAVHPDNAAMDDYDMFGNSFDIYVLNPEYRKITSLLGQITVIQPHDKQGIKNDIIIWE